MTEETSIMSVTQFVYRMPIKRSWLVWTQLGLEDYSLMTQIVDVRLELDLKFNGLSTTLPSSSQCSSVTTGVKAGCFKNYFIYLFILAEKAPTQCWRYILFNACCIHIYLMDHHVRCKKKCSSVTFPLVFTS